MANADFRYDSTDYSSFPLLGNSDLRRSFLKICTAPPVTISENKVEQNNGGISKRLVRI
jgi:hypothetical protein